MFGDGVTQETIDDFGGLRAMADACIATGCCCEPCSQHRAIWSDPSANHDDKCDDYICLRCDAVEWLEGTP